VGTDVVVKYGTRDFSVMVFSQNDLLLSVRTAHSRTIAVTALQDLPGTDTLNPSNFTGRFAVGRPPDFALVRPGSAQDTLEIQAGDDVLHLSIAIITTQPGIEGLKTRSKDNSTNVYLNLLRDLVKIYSLVFADTLADAAFLFFKVQTALIYVRNERDSLRVINMDSLIFRYGLVELVGILYGAVFYTGSTAPAFVLVNITGFFDQCDLEVARLAFDCANFGIGQDFDVLLSVDLDQFR
jgi:hypothetical protein